MGNDPPPEGARSLLTAAREADRLGRYAEAARLADEATAACATQPNDPDAHVDALVLRAGLSRYEGRLGAADRLLESARAIIATTMTTPLTRGRLDLEIALRELEGDRWGAADAHLESALAAAATLLAGEAPAPSAADIDAARALRIRALAAIGSAQRQRGAYDDAERRLVGAVIEAEAALDEARERDTATMDLVHVTVELGILYKFRASYPASLAAYELARSMMASIGMADHPDMATIEHNIGGVLHAQGEYAAAEAPARRAVELHGATLGPEHLATILDRSALAAVLDALGRSSEAEALLVDCIAALEASVGTNHRELGVALNNVAAIAQRAGRLSEAEAYHRRALAIKERTVGADAPSLAISLNNLAGVLRKQGRAAEARACYERAMAIVVASNGEEHPLLGTIRRNLARVAGDGHVSER